jgi:predicted DNA-binding transcriptional regulator YafY
LHASAEEVTSRVPFHWGTITPIDGNSCEYRTGDDNLRWLALRVVMLGVDFELHEPPELAEQLKEVADRLRRGATSRR